MAGLTAIEASADGQIDSSSSYSIQVDETIN